VQCPFAKPLRTSAFADGRIDLNSKADALASTANFLKAHGWVRGAGYQPGEPNFAAIQGWNAARVYEEAIATIGRQIDEH
jgi:membrane-bound lytic murein transglycosylase B